MGDLGPHSEGIGQPHGVPELPGTGGHPDPAGAAPVAGSRAGWGAGCGPQPDGAAVAPEASAPPATGDPRPDAFARPATGDPRPEASARLATGDPRPEASAPRLRPAALCLGPGHLVVHGNPSFVQAFGRVALGVPAREGLVALPAEAFAVLDAVMSTGRPRARWIRLWDDTWRLTAAPRLDPETAEVYGVRLFLRHGSDLPAALARSDPPGSEMTISPPYAADRVPPRPSGPAAPGAAQRTAE